MTTAIIDRVMERLRPRASDASEPRVTVGDRAILVAVEHPESGRLAGLAHSPDGADETPTALDGTQSSVDETPITDVEELIEWAVGSETRTERAVGLAAINALSAPSIDWQSGDPMAMVPEGADRIATVGLFEPAFRKFDDLTVRVVERDPPESVDAPSDVSVETYAPSRCAEAFAGVDCCFVTGSAYVYGGIDQYVDALSAAGVSPVVLVGATASHLPEPAFEAGIDVVAGVRVTDPERVRDRVLAGDCGTDLHDNGVAKGYVARDEVNDFPNPDKATRKPNKS